MSARIRVCEAADYVSISKLKFHPENPRVIGRDGIENLKQSIKKKGIYRPFLVWSHGDVLLSGNKRAEAALALIEEGHTFVAPNGDKDAMPVTYVRTKDAELARQILVESNTHQGDWDEDKLRALVSKAESAAVFGLSQDFLDTLLRSAVGEAEAELERVNRRIEPPTPGDVEPHEGEEYDSLILPKEVCADLVTLLAEIDASMGTPPPDDDSPPQLDQAAAWLVGHLKENRRNLLVACVPVKTRKK